MLMMFKTIKIWVDLEIVTWQKNGPILWNWWCPTSKPISPTKMNDSKDKVNPEQQKKKVRVLNASTEKDPSSHVPSFNCRHRARMIDDKESAKYPVVIAK